MQLLVLISGKVQGVGFRYFTKVNATKLGVKGYAKNLTNGKVEVVAEGDKEKLYALIKQLRIGPSASKVDNVKIEEREFTGQFDSFGIRY
ncbi:acylphosphatase [Candidatus Poribacteria bacterium]|nr:acylphosphatase [Candidatus Poribacteria bacterium]